MLVVCQLVAASMRCGISLFLFFVKDQFATDYDAMPKFVTVVTPMFIPACLPQVAFSFIESMTVVIVFPTFAIVRILVAWCATLRFISNCSVYIEFIPQPHGPCLLQNDRPTSPWVSCNVQPKIFVIGINIVPYECVRNRVNYVIVFYQFPSSVWVSTCVDIGEYMECLFPFAKTVGDNAFRNRSPEGLSVSNDQFHSAILERLNPVFREQLAKINVLARCDSLSYCLIYMPTDHDIILVHNRHALIYVNKLIN